MSSAMVQTLPLLVIEDERSVVDFIRLALERHGYSCRTASSGSEGIAMLESGGFYGVISDMRTPGGISGADVHAWIVAHRPELRDKILFITGDTVNPETMKALNETGVPYIEKPFRVNDLMSVVEKIFGNRND
jgi:DNA-binding NtrC family response regulator